MLCAPPSAPGSPPVARTTSNVIVSESVPSSPRTSSAWCRGNTLGCGVQRSSDPLDSSQPSGAPGVPRARVGGPEWEGDAWAPSARLPPLLGRREAASWEELSIRC